MLKLTLDQRRLVLDKLPDAANIAFGALGFGPFIGDGRFSLIVIVVGAGLWVVAFGICFVVGGTNCDDHANGKRGVHPRRHRARRVNSPDS